MYVQFNNENVIYNQLHANTLCYFYFTGMVNVPAFSIDICAETEVNGDLASMRQAVRWLF